jgi:hypothetical protein
MIISPLCDSLIMARDYQIPNATQAFIFLIRGPRVIGQVLTFRNGM